MSAYDLRLGRYQDVLADVEVDAVRRFCGYVATSDELACWPWTGRVDDDGYGVFSLSHRKAVRAHRMALALARGAWPTLYVLHSCDNRRCCNPVHLREGTQAENIADMDARGRRGIMPIEKRARGARHGLVKRPDLAARGEGAKKSALREADVLSIRHRAGNGVAKRALAREYGLSPKAIQMIVARRTWAHVGSGA